MTDDEVHMMFVVLLALMACSSATYGAHNEKALYERFKSQLSYLMLDLTDDQYKAILRQWKAQSLPNKQAILEIITEANKNYFANKHDPTFFTVNSLLLNRVAPLQAVMKNREEIKAYGNTFTKRINDLAYDILDSDLPVRERLFAIVPALSEPDSHYAYDAKDAVLRLLNSSTWQDDEALKKHYDTINALKEKLSEGGNHQEWSNEVAQMEVALKQILTETPGGNQKAFQDWYRRDEPGVVKTRDDVLTLLRAARNNVHHDLLKKWFQLQEDFARFLFARTRKL